MTHPAFTAESTAVVTGGASGIGLAAAKRFAALGMRIVIVDRRADLLDVAADAVRSAGAAEVMIADTDVSRLDAMQTLEAKVTDHFGGADIVMNNAAIQSGSTLFGPQAVWDSVIATNLGGVINGTRVFGPGMVSRGRAGAIINTGSKQGITTPPGDPAYNVAKAGVKVVTEALAHDLRTTDGCQITAHLLIPGFVWTDLTRGDRTEKPSGAWTPEETADFMMDRMNAGDFYILCPDNDVDRATDEKRMAWAMGDLIENRPPLSRWHPDYADAFKAFLEK